MISIYKEVYFKVLKPEAFDLDIGVCGHRLWKNTALTNPTLVHSHGFGKGFYGDSYASMWAGFDTVTKEFRVYCNSDEDMTWLCFDEDNLEELNDKDDYECARYTIKFLRKLSKQGIIEIQED